MVQDIGGAPWQNGSPKGDPEYGVDGDRCHGPADGVCVASAEECGAVWRGLSGVRIPRKTGNKWKQRFLEEGLSGLGDQSRRPETSPNELGESMVCQIVKLRLAHPTWGARKLRAVLERTVAKESLPSESSFKRVLDKAGLVQRRRRLAAGQSGRLQTPTRAERPNQVWTIDFKGWWYTRNRRAVWFCRLCLGEIDCTTHKFHATPPAAEETSP